MHLYRIKRCCLRWQCLLLCLFPALNVPAQPADRSELWVHYNSQNSELSNNTVYATETDQKGYTWFCTPDGLFQYNGRTIIKVFKDELPQHTEFINFFKDSKKGLWLMGFEGQLFRIDLDRYTTTEINYKNKRPSPYNGKHTIYYGYENRDGVHFLNSNFCKISIGKDTSIEKLPYPPVRYYNDFLNRDMPSYRHFPVSFPGHAVLRSRISNGYYICFNKVYIPGKDTLLHCLFDGDQQGITDQIIDVTASGNDLLLATYSASGGIFRVNQYKNSSGRMHIDTLLRQPFLTGIREDKYHNLWASSYNDGIFLLPRIFTQAYLFPVTALPHAGNFIDLNVVQQSLYATSDNGMIYQFNHKLLLLKALPYGNTYNNTGSIADNNNGLITLSGPAAFRVRHQNGTIEQLGIVPHISPKKLLQADSSTLLLLSKTNIACYSFSRQQTEWLYQSRQNISAAVMNGNTFWLATSDSLFKTDLRDNRHPLEAIMGGSKINALHIYQDTLWAATSEGICFIAPGQNVRYISETRQNGQLFSDCRQVKIYPEYILGIYPQGIQLFHRHSDQPVYEYHSNNSLYHFILEDALLSHNTLYLVTDKGLIAQPLQQLTRETIFPELRFTDYRTNSDRKQHWINDTLRRPYAKEQTITMGFDYQNGDPQYTQFWYSLSNNSDEKSKWIKIHSNEIILDQLQPGTYCLTLRSRENTNNASDIIACKWIIISPLWYQTTLFLSITVLSALFVIGLLVWGFTSLRIKRKHNRSLQERSILEMEGKAMLNQLNPHFVFNALNPLQYYIASKQNQEALQYLQKFAGLFRKMLQMSSDNNNTIAEELRFLEEYLFIQRTRYDEYFDYTVTVCDNTNLQHYLPPMLIQPLVENAIEHGILGMPNKGMISIRILTDKNYINISVTDNGKGPGENKEIIFKKGHALYIVTERLKLMKGKHGISGTFSILREDDHTIFSLQIPVTLQNHNHVH